MSNAKLDYIAQFAYSYRTTIQNSYDMTILVVAEGIKGDLVECGVAAGAQIGAFQQALHDCNSIRKIWAFDSYEGIPLAGEYDTLQAGIGEITHDKYLPIEQRLVTSGITAHSLKDVKSNFSKWQLPIDNIEFVEGWFQHTLPKNSEKIKEIAILRLDGDLHESTIVCLEHLYPKVSIGGVVIIDDYALDGCRIALEQYFEKNNIPFPYLTKVDGHSVVYFIKK